MHAVLNALGIKLSEIDGWNCCGGAAAHCLSGLLGLALPARNIAKAQVYNLPLAVPCPACFNAIKRAQWVLSNDPEMRKTLEDVVGFRYSEKLEVTTIHKMILDDVGIDTLKSRVKRPLSGLKIVSYYGCLLVRHPEVVQMGDYENPLFLDEVVETIGGDAQDWSFKTDCCGADLGMTHGKMATEITDRITGMAIEARADLIMTGCGLCQVNLDMRQSGKEQVKIPVLYMTELLGLAMDLPGRNKWWGMHVVDPLPLLKSRNLL
jgi:heterodisulfide reductase subunit B